MDLQLLKETLKELPLGSVHFAKTTGSTNDDALAFARMGAVDLSLFVADEQTAGRGRLNRRWYTPKGSALAFSLVLQNKVVLPGANSSTSLPENLFPRLNGLGALCVAQTLIEDYGLQAQIKWPNDVLVGGKKVAGVLVEATWEGEQTVFVVIGIGVNVKPSSVPPQESVNFPADCIENLLQEKIDRAVLLRRILNRMIYWHSQTASEEFIKLWDSLLALRGKWVQITAGSPRESTQEGRVLGLDSYGFLMLVDREGNEFSLQTGDVQIIP